jgi:hypothetical protein
MSWADLDKVSVKQRADGSALLVVHDGRTFAQISEARLVSILVAMCRVARAREALEQKFANKGAVTVVTSGEPPGFFVEAVSSAGGVVFDGKREHAFPKPMSATMLLDSTLCDLATAVRRRVNVRTFRDALEVREHELRRKPVAKTELVAYWSTVFELVALAGELYRAEEPGKWELVGSARPPLGLKQPKKPMVFPAEQAQAIAAGGTASLRTAVDLAKPRAPNAPLETSLRAMPLLVHRRSVEVDALTWEPLVPADADHHELPVIAYVEDQPAELFWPKNQGAPTRALRSRAIDNLGRTDFAIESIDVGDTRVALVVHENFGCEAVLHRPTMKQIEQLLGGDTLVVGFPERGQMLATTIADDDDLLPFLHLVDNRFHAAPEHARISSEVVVYTDGKVLERLHSLAMDTRRAMRRMGIDPDA